MAALSRGLGLAMSQRIFSFVPTTASKTCSERPMARVAQAVRYSPIIQAARNLQTSARLQGPKFLPPKPRGPPTSIPKTAAGIDRESASATQANTVISGLRSGPPSATVRTVTPKALAAKLASLGRPTILYQSSGHFWLRFSSISAAVFCLMYALINYYGNILYPPPDISKYVVLAFAVICLFMGAMGYLFLISTARIVRRITAVPTSALPQSYVDLHAASMRKMSEAEKSALKALKASPIALECECAATLPLLGRTFVAAPSEVTVPFKWTQAPVARGAEAPTGLAGWFLSMRRGLIAEGFSPIMVKGQRYKIDVMAGKVFDHGRSLEILMPPQPTKFTDSVLDRILRR